MKANSHVSEKESQALVIARVFEASRERVWRAWTEPDFVTRWWGPRAFTSPACKIDFRVGGKYLFCMKADSGPEAWRKGIWSTGVYKEIVPLEKIVFTDCFADDRGNAVSAAHYGMSEDFPLELLVTVMLEDYQGKSTRMLLRHEGLPAAMLEECRTGWNESFDKLAGILK